MRSSAPTRFLAGLVLALFALGWLGDLVHGAFERHAWCDEHQRVEHAHGAALGAACAGDAVSGDHADAHALAQPSSGPTRSAPCAPRAPGFAPSSAPSADHEACGALLARGGDPVALPPHDAAVAAFALDPARAPRAVRSAAARAQVPLILLAPKQSPPAV